MDWLPASLLDLVSSLSSVAGLAVLATLIMVVILISTVVSRVFATPLRRMLSPTENTTQRQE